MFKKYPGVKVIVATKVAQTSITIDDIDAVVDSGLERQNQVKNGVEGLYMNPISQADCLQRAGRAGRTKEGEYVLAQLGNSPFVALKDREPYGTPEILRTRLDGMVLRLAKNGFDAATMDFYHSKDEYGRDMRPEIAAAKERLQKLGALREDDSITKIGRDMERMPVESHYARMMIEARKYGPEVQLQLAAMLAVQEAGGITQFSSRNKPSDERWRSLLQPGVNDSDMIKQLEVFIAAQSMSDREKRDNDIFVKAFSKANEVLRQLRGVEKLRDQDLVVPIAEQREQLVKCMISGMVDNLYVNDYYGHRDAKGNVREVSSRSIIRAGKMVVGKPFDLQINTRRGMTTLNLLESPTNVPSVELLREVAPQLFTEQSRGLTIGDDGAVHERFAQIFNGHDMGEESIRSAKESEARTAYLAHYAAERQWHTSEVQATIKTINDLNNRAPGAVGTITFENIHEVIAEAMPTSVATVDEASAYVPQFTLDDLVSPLERAVIYATSPGIYGGRGLLYKDGVPMFSESMSEDEILELVAEKWALPDGRPIVLRDYWSGNTMDIVEKQRRILQARAEQAEREKQEHKRRVEGVIRYFERGYSQEQVSGLFGSKASDEAKVLYETGLVEREATERAEQERKRLEAADAAARQEAAIAEINKLIKLNDDLYDRTRLAGLDDAPDSITSEVEAMRRKLDDINNELNRDKERVAWGYEAALDAYADQMKGLQTRLAVCAQRFLDWQAEQKARDSRPASTDDIAALMAKFNKR